MSVTEKLNGYGPLNGVKVVELCEWVAAPATVRVLSEMGAEIIKVEPLHGDAQRTQGPGFGCEQTEREDPTIDLNNTNKNWLSLNLKTEEGSKVMHQLLATADVFVNNLRDKALVKLGLDYASLKEKYPTLIWAQMRGYGEFGPERDTPASTRCAGRRAAAWRTCSARTASPPPSRLRRSATTTRRPSFPAASSPRCSTAPARARATRSPATCTARPSGAATSASWPRSSARPTQVPQGGSEPLQHTYKTSDDKWMLICMPQYDKYYNMMMEITGNDEHKDQPDTCNLPSLKASGKQHESSAGSRTPSPRRRSRSGTRSCASTRCPTRSASATPTSSRTKRPTTTTRCAGWSTRRSARRPSPCRRCASTTTATRRSSSPSPSATTRPSSCRPGLQRRRDRRDGGEGSHQVLPRRRGAGRHLQVRASDRGEAPCNW